MLFLFYPQVRKIAEKIASLSSPIMQMGKKAFYEQVAMELNDAYRLNIRWLLLAVMIVSYFGPVARNIV